MSAETNTAFQPNGQPRALNRRSFLINAAALGAAAAAIAAPAITMAQPAINRAAWDAAVAEYNSAKHAMDHEDGDAVVGRFIDAEKTMLDTRTPDMRALRWKMERMRDISDCSVIEPKDFDQLLADITRLLGGA